MVAQKSVPEETHLGVSETKQQFSKLINEVASGGSRVIVEKHGLESVAMIDIGAYRRFVRHEAWERERDAALLKIGQAFADVPMDELERQIDIAVAEVRRKRREGLSDEAES